METQTISNNFTQWARTSFSRYYLLREMSNGNLTSRHCPLRKTTKLASLKHKTVLADFISLEKIQRWVHKTVYHFLQTTLYVLKHKSNEMKICWIFGAFFSSFAKEILSSAGVAVILNAVKLLLQCLLCFSLYCAYVNLDVVLNVCKKNRSWHSDINVKYPAMRNNKACRPLDFRRSQTVVGSNHFDKCKYRSLRSNGQCCQWQPEKGARNIWLNKIPLKWPLIQSPPRLLTIELNKSCLVFQVMVYRILNHRYRVRHVCLWHVPTRAGPLLQWTELQTCIQHVQQKHMWAGPKYICKYK